MTAAPVDRAAASRLVAALEPAWTAIRSRRSSAGTSGHGQRIRTAGQRLYTHQASAAEPRRRRL
jgi:hypothetical protein